MQRFPVVVTGLGVICAAGASVPEFWDNLKAGRSGISKVDRSPFAGQRYEPGSGAEAGGDGGQDLDEVFAGRVDDAVLRPRVEAIGADPDVLDRVSQMSIVAAHEALAAAGWDPGPTVGSELPRTGVVMGRCSGESSGGDRRYVWVHAPCEAIAHHFGFDGPRLMVSTACAAGSNAVGTGRDKLWTGEADLVLAGGADGLSASTLAGFVGMQALSDGPCAPYSRSDGLSLGEGAAFLVLEPLDAAVARGAPILAEVLGYGLSADAYHPTAPDPTGRGAVSAVRRGLSEAELSPEAIDYVNGHGTGTPTNDKMERKAMKTLFGPRVSEVPVSSTKALVGHTLGAAGAIEAVACVLAIVDDMLPPTANFEGDGDAELDFVPNVARPARVDVAMSTSYAFGGNNASLVLRKPGSSRSPVPVRQPVSITGIGLVGPLGVGLDAWRDAFREGRTGIGPIRSFDTAELPTAFAGEMCELDGHGFAPSSEWRRMDRITRQALAAARLALDDGDYALGRQARDDLAVILGTSFGPINTTLGFARTFATDISVRSFSQVTFNAPAGVVCKNLGVRGPTTTITTGSLSGTHALATAFELLTLGKASTALVIATDELFPELFVTRAALDHVAPDATSFPYDKARSGIIAGSAAVALLLETTRGAEERSAVPYADLLATHHGSDTGDRLAFSSTGQPWARVVDAALHQAQVDAAHVGYCAGWAGGHPQDDVELAAIDLALASGTPVGAPKSFTGDCEAASGVINVAVAALALFDGLLVPTLGLSMPSSGSIERHVTEARPADLQAAVALDAAFGSGYGAVVLGRSL